MRLLRPGENWKVCYWPWRWLSTGWWNSSKTSAKRVTKALRYSPFTRDNAPVPNLLNTCNSYYCSSDIYRPSLCTGSTKQQVQDQYVQRLTAAGRLSERSQLHFRSHTGWAGEVRTYRSIFKPLMHVVLLLYSRLRLVCTLSVRMF